MKMLFIGLLGAGWTFATPTQARLIGTDFYVPSIMLQMCKSEIARGQVGFCTGYVIAKWEELAAGGEVCLPSNVEYEDMLSAVIRRFEEGSGWMKSGDTDLQVRIALRDEWPCKK